jgi:hypothetical protein
VFQIKGDKFMFIAFFGIVGFWLLCNILVVINMTTDEMVDELYTEQNFAGKIFANLFYFPAWACKFFYEIIRPLKLNVDR